MRRRGDTISRALNGGGLERPVRVWHHLTSVEFERLGSAGEAGFRIKVEADEDDGGSRFDDFIVRR